MQSKNILCVNKNWILKAIAKKSKRNSGLRQCFHAFPRRGETSGVEEFTPESQKNFPVLQFRSVS